VTPHAQFVLPLFFEYGATFIWAITGAGMAVRRGYDYSGIFVMAFVSAMGGGLLRDGLFLQQGPAIAVRGPAYLELVVAGAVVGAVAAVAAGGRKPNAFWRAFSDIVDALGLGAYSCVGAQMSLQLGLGIPSAIFIGVVNGIGGGLLRDVLVNRIWMLPGQLLGIPAVIGTVLFVALVENPMHVDPTWSAWIAIAVTFVARLLAIRYNWRTRALLPPDALAANEE
jgi:uncharacterized membrane protein YeiH